MILIVVKFRTKPEYTERWPEIVDEFTRATRAEPGNIFFEWSMSLDTDDEWVLVEAFQDDAAEAQGYAQPLPRRDALAALCRVLDPNCC